AFVVTQQVRRGVASRACARAAQQCFEHRGAGSLAVGAGNVDDGCRLPELEASEDLEHALETEVDLARRQRLEPGQPVVERVKRSLKFRRHRCTTTTQEPTSGTPPRVPMSAWLNMTCTELPSRGKPHAVSAAGGGSAGGGSIAEGFGRFASFARRSPISSRILRRSTIMSMAPWSSRNSLRWNPSGSFWRTVCSMTLGPAKPISACGSAMFTSPSIARLAETPPVVGSVMTEM